MFCVWSLLKTLQMSCWEVQERKLSLCLCAGVQAVGRWEQRGRGGASAARSRTEQQPTLLLELCTCKDTWIIYFCHWREPSVVVWGYSGVVTVVRADVSILFLSDLSSDFALVLKLMDRSGILHLFYRPFTLFCWLNSTLSGFKIPQAWRFGS